MNIPIFQAMRKMDKEYKELKEKGTEDLADLEELNLEFMRLDLSSFQSTKEFVEAFKKSGRQLHVLVCNAGVSKANYGKPHFFMLFPSAYLNRRPKKRTLRFSFKCACAVPYLGYRQSFLLEASLRSTTCMRLAKALARLRLCAGSPEPLRVAYVISTLFSSAGSSMTITNTS